MNALTKTILVIEDSEEMRENTAEILELGNYHVITAENGKEGFEKIMTGDPDLIICDVMMPVMDGFDLLKNIGSIKEKKQIPFLFLSARSEKADIKTGYILGAKDYLVKPFKGEDLLRIVNEKLHASHSSF